MTMGGHFIIPTVGRDQLHVTLDGEAPTIEAAFAWCLSRIELYAITDPMITINPVWAAGEDERFRYDIRLTGIPAGHELAPPAEAQ